jgi:16S rRNA (cytosine967-C5)-methyltransferase
VSASPTTPFDARSIAARVLVRVEVDHAFAAPVLDAEIDAHPQIDPRDARLATELVYGVLRTRGFLVAELEAFSRRGIGVREPAAFAHLLIGAYSILFLDRVPVFAAVSEAVTAIGAVESRSTAAYANAVLRGLARKVDERGRPDLPKAIVDGAPGWLRGALRRSLGRGAAAEFLAAGPVPPPLGLALADPSTRDAHLATLAAAAPSAVFEPSSLSPRGILARGAGDPKRLPGFERSFIVQEEGAQVLTALVGARPGELVLDACAGRGNKAWVLAHDVGPSGRVEACDLYPAKLEALESGPRAGLVRAVHAVDWSVGTGDVPDGFDRVLCDAPCSGIGTLRRRPEIALHRSVDDVSDLVRLQIAIARRAATRAKDGGRFVFAVCSVLREECEGVVEALVEPAFGVRLEPIPFDAPGLAALTAGASALRLLPHVHGTDGYFAASFVVRRL